MYQAICYLFKLKNMRNIIILVLIVITFTTIEIGIKEVYDTVPNDIIEINNKYDSIISLYSILLKADSIKTDRLNKSFYLDKDSVIIDSRGYFRSKYHNQYKIRKD